MTMMTGGRATEVMEVMEAEEEETAEGEEGEEEEEEEEEGRRCCWCSIRGYSRPTRRMTPALSTSR